MAYTTIDNPELYFQIKLYTGDGSTPSITLDGDTDMQPDMVWIKNRDEADSHCLFDSVRGATEVLHPNADTIDTTDADTLDSFTSDGFQVDADVKVNTNTENYVAWCWKESATSGVDIVSFTGTGSAHTESHSLSAVPHFIILRNRETVENWAVYHHSDTAAPETELLRLNLTNATSDQDGMWNDTAPTSSVFTVGTSTYTNENTKGMIGYLFTSIQGFNKFGGYTGNGNADGPFIYTGFRPAWAMFKKYNGAENWEIYDSKRLGYNPSSYQVVASANDTENTDGGRLDFLSNGFKIRTTGTGLNISGSPYIYAAFAEAPFVNSNGVPCNAR